MTVAIIIFVTVVLFLLLWIFFSTNFHAGPTGGVDYSPELRVLSHNVGELHVNSWSKKNVKYTVNLAELTCTCRGAWVRGRIDRKLFARCCHHLIAELQERELIEYHDEWIKPILEAGYGWPSKAWLVTLPSQQRVIIAEHHGNHFTKIYARKKRRGETVADASGQVELFEWEHRYHDWFGSVTPQDREKY